MHFMDRLSRLQADCELHYQTIQSKVMVSSLLVQMIKEGGRNQIYRLLPFKARVASQIGVGDISKTNYRKPIYRHFSNYRQNYRYRKFEFGNYRQIIDIGKCIKFGPINI